MMDAWIRFVLKADMKMTKSAGILDFPLSIKLERLTLDIYISPGGEHIAAKPGTKTDYKC